MSTGDPNPYAAPREDFGIPPRRGDMLVDAGLGQQLAKLAASMRIVGIALGVAAALAVVVLAIVFLAMLA